MKHIIILGDGMADHKVASLGEKTLLQYARPEYMNRLAREGRCGRLVTVPEGFPPGSEVANTAILGYDLNKVYEGRGPLEAASIGYEMQDDDFAIRCNIITIEDGKIITHNGGNLETDDARILIDYLNEHLGNERVKFICEVGLLDTMLDRFGTKGVFYAWIDDEHFSCEPIVELNHQFYGWVCGFGESLKIETPEIAERYAAYLARIHAMY